MFLSNTHSFSLARKQSIRQDFSSGTETLTTVIRETQSATVLPASSGDTAVGRSSMFLSNTHSFSLARKQSIELGLSSGTETLTTTIRETESTVVPLESPEESIVREAQSTAVSTEPSEDTAVGDTDRRSFLKVAGIAGAGLVASQLFPNKASALILGSSPTTGVVGVKNASNVKINPATEETLSGLLKTSDLTFDTGALQVKVTSLPAAGNSFSDSGNVAKSGLVDADRHVQVDVLSSTLPTSASTETTLQTISFGGFKFTLRMATIGEVDYVGEAAIGTTTSSASWRIKKVDNTSGLVLQWAGTGVFNQIWDNRSSLSYS